MSLWAAANPALSTRLCLGGAPISNAFAFWIARNLIARGLIYLVGWTETQVDDALVRHMRPYCFAWLAPMLVAYYPAQWMPEWADTI